MTLVNYIPSSSSTQDEIINHSECLNNFYTIYTFNQTKGRGQRDTKWENNEGQNIALSFLLKDIDPEYLSFWVACQLNVFFQDLTNFPTFIKWPNDIIIKNKKIAGILIERKSINHKIINVIGIGINVNQTDFPNLPNAGSLKNLTSMTYDLHHLTLELITFLKSKFHELNQDIIPLYNMYLYKKDKISVFKINGNLKNGIIKQVDNKGQLHILFEDDSTSIFKHKEIEMMY